MHDISHILWFFALSIGLSLLNPYGAHTKEPSYMLHIEIHEHGVAKIHARLHLQTSPEQAFDILTKYERWPKLFPKGFQIHISDCTGDCTVITDMVIPHALVPWTTRLRTQSIESPPKNFELHLLEGDYLQYQLRWEFAPAQNPEQTQAIMTLTLQPKGSLIKWTPDFLYEWMLRKGLEDHLDKVQEQVAITSEHYSPANP